MGTFASLQTEVQTLLIDVPTAVANLTGTWVNRALRKLERKHNFKDMEMTATFTTVTQTFNLGTRPSNWKQANGNPYYSEPPNGREFEMVWTDRANAGSRWGSDTTIDFGAPRALVETSAGAFQVWPAPDGLANTTSGQYLVTVPYWGYLDDLAASNDTNWFTVNAEEWIVFQAVANGFYANEDEKRAQLWEVRAIKEFKEVLDLDKRRRLAETQDLVPHVGARRPHTQE